MWLWLSTPMLLSSPADLCQVFFLKAQLLAGRVQLDDRELEDYLWLTKEEIRDYVSEDYYSAVEHTLMS